MFTCVDLPSLDGSLESVVEFIPNMSGEEYSHRYIQVDLLGEGHFAQVHKVVDTQTQRVLALKQAYTILEVAIPCLLSSTADATDCIMRVVNWFRLEGDIYFTTPIIGQKLVESFVARLTKTELLALIFELTIAVKVMGEAGVCHSDLQLGNILIQKTTLVRVYVVNGRQYVVNSQYTPIVIDFGISKLIEREVTAYHQDPRMRRKFQNEAEVRTYFQDIDWYGLGYVIYDLNGLRGTPSYIGGSLPNPASPSLLRDPMFNPLIDEPIYPGTTVKFYREQIV